MAKSTTTEESTKTEAVRYTQGASGRVYGSKDKEGKDAPAAAKSPAKKTVKKIAKKKAKKAAKKSAAKKPAAAPIKPPTTAKEHSAVLAQTVVTSFTDRLKMEAGKKGGMLTIDDIDNLNEEFEQKMGALETVFEASFNQFLKAHDQAPDEVAPKTMPFNRLLISRFARFFKEGTISRRILPGFNMAIGMMLGQELLDGYQERCHAIMKRLGGGNEDNCELSTYYYYDEAGKVVLDAQIAMTFHFKSFDRRVEWFVDLVNDHLAPASDNADDKEKAYEFTKGGLIRIFDAMLTDLKEAISTEGGRIAITKQYGVETIIELADTLQLIDDIRAKQGAAEKKSEKTAKK